MGSSPGVAEPTPVTDEESIWRKISTQIRDNPVPIRVMNSKPEPPTEATRRTTRAHARKVILDMYELLMAQGYSTNEAYYIIQDGLKHADKLKNPHSMAMPTTP